jgi:hypothetical protein
MSRRYDTFSFAAPELKHRFLPDGAVSEGWVVSVRRWVRSVVFSGDPDDEGGFREYMMVPDQLHRYVVIE